jgi:DNA-binding Lrp family transcriptional regulator
MKNETEQFLKMSYDILENKQLNAGEKITLALIYSFHNNKKEMYMSYGKMASRMGVSRTTAVDRINTLREKGYIETKEIHSKRRIIIPLRMVEIPTNVVDVPTTMVDVPTDNGRNTEQSMVDVVGAIIYPSLDKKLDSQSNNGLNNQIKEILHQTTGAVVNGKELKGKIRAKILEDFSTYYKTEFDQMNNLFACIDRCDYNTIINRTKLDSITPEQMELFIWYERIDITIDYPTEELPELLVQYVK